jgi:hypothetical protein
MNSLELLEFLKQSAKNYIPEAVYSLKSNSHMHNCEEYPDHEQIAAILSNFINTIGHNSGVDYALNSSDLKS